jgi:hypothetical protein
VVEGAECQPAEHDVPMLTAGARLASCFATVVPHTDAFSLFLIRSFAAEGFGIAIALLNVHVVPGNWTQGEAQ